MNKIGFAVFLVLTACGTTDGPSLTTAATPSVGSLTLPSSKIATTAIDSASATFAWTKATDSVYAQSQLTYSVYISAANPAYGIFETVTQAQSGTLVGGGQDISSLTVNTGFAAGSAYYVNVVVTNPGGLAAIYAPHGEFFEANLLAYYPFDNSNADISVNANNAVPTNAPTFTTDRFGFTSSSVNFTSGSSQKLTSTASVSPGTSSRTASFWLKAAGAPGTAVFGLGASANTIGQTFGFYYSSPDYHVWCYDNCDLTVSSIPTTNWEHWVIVYDQSTQFISAYKNGVAVLAPTAPGGSSSISTLPGALVIGTGVTTSNNDQNDYFFGAVDDFRLYARALSSGEIANLFTVTQP